MSDLAPLATLDLGLLIQLLRPFLPENPFNTMDSVARALSSTSPVDQVPPPTSMTGRFGTTMPLHLYRRVSPAPTPSRYYLYTVR